jgi:segregation and condensation protein B
MSLRAKLEAVIYAAEEPVTLAQLSTLFAAEALEGRAARNGISSAPRSAGSAAEEYSPAPTSDTAIDQAIEHPEQVSETQPDGFAGEPEPALEGKSGDSTDTGSREAEGVGSEAGDGKAAGEGTIDEERDPRGLERDARGLERDARSLEREARGREREAREEIRRLVDELIAEYDNGDRGLEIREIAGGYRVATKPEYHDAVRGFVRSLKPPMKLSLQALETLAVIAYKQPVTAPEVSEIRGVDSGGVLGSLISRKLVTTAGRKQVIGRPILYKTTKEFLLRFGLKDLNELPSMEEFEKMAGELAESEAVPLSGPAAASPAVLAEGFEETSTQQPPEGEIPVDTGENAMPDENQEPSAAAEVEAAPELAEALEEEELAARARAAVQVDDESAPDADLPGVHRDTAGRVSIDSVPHRPQHRPEEQ